MKVDTSREVATNIHGAVNFKLSQDAHKLFSMLSDYLYADKEFCVLYELSTNADDEHKQAGVTQPFDVILPTRLSNKLVIRDYGRGLPENLIYDLLGTYGASGKAQDANAIGGWGIGFKSVAAVSTTWNIISRNNGVETHYLVFVTGSGIPAITKTVSNPTTESGLEIQIPIETGHEHIWQGLITKVYKHFPTKPNVINYSQSVINWPQEKNGVSGLGWALREGDFNYSSMKFITSHREYDANSAKLRESLDQKYHFMLGMPFLFHFEIGELDLSISRESVQYTAKSIKAINERIVKVHDEVVAAMSVELDKATDELNYRELIFSTVPKIFGGRTNLNNMATACFMKRAVAGKYGINSLPDDAQSVLIPLTGKNWAYNGKTLTEIKPGFNCWKSHIATVTTDPLDKNKKIMRIKIDRLNRCEFYLKDVYDAGARVRSNHDGSTKFMFLFEKNTMPAIMKKKLLKASTLVKKARTATTATKSQGDVYRVWKATFAKTTFDPKSKNGYCYIVADNVRDHWWMTQDLRAKVNFMQENGYVVLAVKKNVTPPAGVRDIDAEMKHRAAELLVHPDLKKEELAYQWDKIADYNQYQLRAFYVVLSKYETKKPSAWNTLRSSMKDLLDYAKSNHNSRYTPMTDKYNQYAHMLGQPPIKYKFAINSKDAYDDIKLKYPLIKYVSDSWTETEVIQYIEQCGV